MSLFVCLFGSQYSSNLWWTSPYQGWNLRYPKAGRRVPLRAPETDPSLCRVPGEFAVSGLSRVADWPPGRSSSLLRSACWVVGWEFLEQQMYNKPCAPRPPPLVGMTRYASTPRRHTVEVCASPGPQQARPPPCQCPVVSASRQCACAVTPSSRLCLCLAVTNPRSLSSSAFGCNKPSFLWFSLSTVSWLAYFV